MSRILFATVPIAGHINPLLSLARALATRGHDLRWLSGPKYAARIAATGARFTAFAQARSYDDQRIDEEFPGRSDLSGIDQLRFDLRRIFIDAGPAQLADVEAIARAWRPDVVVADPLMFGAAFAAERLDLPLALVNVLPCTLRSRDTAPFGLGLPPSRSLPGRIRNAVLNRAVEHCVFRGVQRHWRATRAHLNLPTTEFLFDAPRRASRFLLPTIPDFEYPRSDLPANVEFIGPLPIDAPPGIERPPWFNELDGPRPVVHLSQGTIANANPDLFAPAIAGLADEPVLVVVATGGRPAAELGLIDVPDNVRVASLLAYPELLPRTAVMVTNGGYGGVQLALSHGVPLVVAGTTEDKPEVAARVAWSGTGIDLRTANPKPARVRDAVRRLLDEPGYRDAARQLARQYARLDGVANGVAAIEGLATGSGRKRPPSLTPPA